MKCPHCKKEIGTVRAHLTGVEEKMLSFIGDHLRTNGGKSPTLVEIGTACGIKSTGTTHRYVKSLEDKGRLSRGDGGWRTLMPPGVLPFRGTVR